MKRLLPFVILLAACGRSEATKPQAPIGNAQRGMEVIQRYGCQTCHVIPGLPGSGGMLGPSLDHIGSRPMIANKIPMTPENLARYIENPTALDPQSAMPPVGVRTEEAHDAAAFLLTIK